MAKTSGDSSKRVSGNIFRRIQDSFTTQATAPNGIPFVAADCVGDQG